MKIKVLWGFCGDVEKLGPDTNGDSRSPTRAGQVFENVEDEYAYTLIGKGLVQQFDGAAPAATKPAAAPSPSQPGPVVTLQPAPADIKVVGPSTGSAEESGADAPPVSGEAAPIDAAPTAPATVAPTAAAELGSDAEKAALVAELEAAGAVFDRRWGVAKLAEALKSAQGAKVE
ncbi:hypothetical protein CEE60_02715 [Stenotrophomonas maltophilia]|uniref:Uncharacterized protein n=1 Tax=Stenotrophomonas maltophilia TaxID=40324 RepID=A0A246HQZ0_STEMA|nr:hypothetical protein [Stenotrophomonas maltophilia]OWQ56404.1 hypothetical protein CEE60_02715 [Stenotrophomonas maltophilia]